MYFTSGNQHILTIIVHFTGWQEAFPIPERKVDTIVCVFMNSNLPVNIHHIFSAPYHPKSNGKLEVFYKYLKPTLKKLCENDPNNLNQYLNQVLTSCHISPHLATGETPFFFVYGRDPNLPLHQLLEPMQYTLVTQILDVLTWRCIIWL